MVKVSLSIFKCQSPTDKNLFFSPVDLKYKVGYARVPTDVTFNSEAFLISVKLGDVICTLVMP